MKLRHMGSNTQKQVYNQLQYKRQRGQIQLSNREQKTRNLRAGVLLAGAAPLREGREDRSAYPIRPDAPPWVTNEGG